MEQIIEKINNEGKIYDICIIVNNTEQKVPFHSLYKYGYKFLEGVGIVKISDIYELNEKCLDNNIIY